MSKNVAVFVDVANIFYAAKAAGVDIDYVTLLKTATAGRDFVRAYAYTGLDPENENQRQFHQFLARHGYKVVSKDIRKYGDGKVKANLDIELVVDLMKTARNLDIAVVVSGDGDFAPAIRAVQEMGVRVEVVSFRGNTSSDLMDVADLFTDITQIAKVEKGSSRSGRRVAAEGDLSMTAVPEKESEGAPRRRGGRGRARPAEREEVAPTASRRRRVAEPAEPSGGTLVPLPGEKLSRAAVAALAAAAAVEAPPGEEVGAEAPEEATEAIEYQEGAPQGPGGRRRRRRGGRGRGRGRGAERGLPAGEPPGEEEEQLEAYPAPRLPQSTPFGSVWDSQLGVTAGPVLAGEDLDETYEDEPEIPEYLLAERRQQRGQRGGQRGAPRGGRGRGGAYQAALERERFGRGGGGGSVGTPYGSPGGRGPGRTPAARGHAPRGGRPERAPRTYGEPRESFGVDVDPWSEVPPEIEAQLRAELARRPAAEPTGTTAPAPLAPRLAEAAPAEAGTGAARGRGRGRTRTTKTVAQHAASGEAELAAEAAPMPTRRRTAGAAAVAQAGAAEEATESPPKPRSTRAATARPKRTVAARKTAAASDTAAEGSADTPAAAAKPKRTRAPRKAVATAEAAES